MRRLLTYVEPAMPRARPSDDDPYAKVRPELTALEVSVALLVADGLTNGEVGLKLKVGVETVRDYVDRLRDKTGYRRKPVLAIWAHVNRSWLSDKRRPTRPPHPL